MPFTKVHPHKDQVEIGIDKLVPFANHPLDLFRGKRLAEMVDSIRTIGIGQPIIVRPFADGKYEILNGHYRVAAAKELKLNTVPAVILEGLTDVEAKLHVSETNPIGLLLKHGVDIYNAGYKESKGYKNVENVRIFSDNNFSMALDEYIERFLLTDYDLYDSYESIYDMGNPYKLDEEECEVYALAHEIIRLADSSREDEIIKWGKSKEPSDIIAARNAKEAEEEEAKELVNTFIRQDGGYVEQLKTYLDIDLDLYDYSDIKNKREKAKIFYFLYMLKTRDFPNVNVLKLLGTPSMENIDNSFLNWKTYNGSIVKFVKGLLEKELNPQAIENIKGALSYITLAWDKFLDDIRFQMDCFASAEHKYDIEHLLEPVPLLMKTRSNHYDFSPIGTLYLRILQNEYIGQIKDILLINSIQIDSNYNIPSEMIKEMKKLSNLKVKVCNVEKYIDENAKKIAEYVYTKTNISKDERRRIRYNKKKVLIIMDFCIRAKPLINMEHEVTELFIISCLQAILIDSSNETFDYIFHGYQNYMKHKPQVQGALKRDGHIVDALKIYWERKVMDHWYANIGRYDLRCKLRELEKVCDNILMQILTCSNISEMLNAHSFYYNRIAQ